jgi:hypothetical protein
MGLAALLPVRMGGGHNAIRPSGDARGCRRGRQDPARRGVGFVHDVPLGRSAAAARASTGPRATDTSMCTACRTCLSGLSPAPRPSSRGHGSTALSSASGADPRTARQKPTTSTASGLALRQKNLLRRCPVGDPTAPSCSRRDRAPGRCAPPPAEDTPRVSRTPRRSSATVNTAPAPPKPGIWATASSSPAPRLIDGTRNTAAAPPCNTTQSSTPSTAKKELPPTLFAHAFLPNGK